mmetsp:Transcript_20725/g.57362  ORF Transcript_20725/g.57362 Transcript_20725/m.57362 type:complete len:247 (-) Transcript_20725:41-781(-)
MRPCFAKMTAGLAQTAAVTLPLACCSLRSAVSSALSRRRSAPGIPPGHAIASHCLSTQSPINMSATTFSPRDIRTSSSGSTLATVTSAPARVSTSVMQAVSISSESFATGTSTRNVDPSTGAAATCTCPRALRHLLLRLLKQAPRVAFLLMVASAKLATTIDEVPTPVYELAFGCAGSTANLCPGADACVADVRPAGAWNARAAGAKAEAALIISRMMPTTLNTPADGRLQFHGAICKAAPTNSPL